jgi:UDP-glucose 4-epimerase
MRIFVTGAAGYIGSVVTDRLLAHGHSVVAMDNLVHGHRSAVHESATFVEGDLLDRDWLFAQLAQGFDAVVHLAA